MSDTTYKSKVGYKPPVELGYHEGTPEIKSVWDHMRDAEGKILDQVEEHIIAQCSAAVGVKIDREELIKALRYCADVSRRDCTDCEYELYDNCTERLKKDAAAAIEELQDELGLMKIAADGNGREAELLRAEVKRLQDKLCDWCAVCPKERRNPEDCEMLSETPVMYGPSCEKKE